VAVPVVVMAAVGRRHRHPIQLNDATGSDELVGHALPITLRTPVDVACWRSAARSHRLQHHERPSGSTGHQPGQAYSDSRKRRRHQILPVRPPGETRLGIFSGAYGTANRYFRDAVEKAPEDAEAWIGLAASYDKLRRFDLADQAYAQAIKLTGETVQILNDRGYSYLLRGDLTKARVQFQKAYRLDPTNPTVINNLQLLDSSYRFIQRAD